MFDPQSPIHVHTHPTTAMPHQHEWFVNKLRSMGWADRHEYYHTVLASTGRVHSLELKEYASMTMYPDELLDGLCSATTAPPVLAVGDRTRQTTLAEWWGPSFLRHSAIVFGCARCRGNPFGCGRCRNRRLSRG